MHGSPLLEWDHRLIWEKYDYRDFGIIGEPYFDVDFGDVLYLTDTGRRWDGDAFNIRDKVEMFEREKDGSPFGGMIRMNRMGPWRERMNSCERRDGFLRNLGWMEGWMDG